MQQLHTLKDKYQQWQRNLNPKLQYSQDSFMMISTNKTKLSEGSSVMTNKYKMPASAVVHLDKLVFPGVKLIASLN